MGLKAIQNVDALAGLAPTYAAAAADDYVVPEDGDGKLLIHVKNGDTAAHSLTIDDINTVSPIGAAAFNADVTVSVPAGAERMIQLTQLGRFKNADGQIHFDWSLTTGMTVGIFRLR